MESIFEWHQQNPDISLDVYVKARRVVLGESLSAKKLIYLDMNYWITLHEAADKAGADAIEFRLLSALRTRWPRGWFFARLARTPLLN
jgi:hypothetical protein